MRARTAWTSLLTAIAVAGSSPVQGQSPQPPPAPAEVSGSPDAPAVVVAVIAETELDDATVADVRNAVVEALAASADGREVRASSEPQRFADCLDDSGELDAGCVDRALSEQEATAGVLVRLARTTEDGPIQVRAQTFDPGTGAQRGEPIGTELPTAEDTSPADALSSAVGQLVDQLPEPPEPTAESTLLIAANVDGANVRIDRESVGQTPLAPLELEPGQYTVTVTADGFRPFNRRVDVEAGQNARVNADLEPTSEHERMLATQKTDHATAGKPLYTRWYLWAAVGGGVLAAVIAGTAVAASGGDGDNMPGGFPVPAIQP